MQLATAKKVHDARVLYAFDDSGRPCSCPSTGLYIFGTKIHRAESPETPVFKWKHHSIAADRECRIRDMYPPFTKQRSIPVHKVDGTYHKSLAWEIPACFLRTPTGRTLRLFSSRTAHAWSVYGLAARKPVPRYAAVYHPRIASHAQSPHTRVCFQSYTCTDLHEKTCMIGLSPKRGISRVILSHP